MHMKKLYNFRLNPELIKKLDQKQGSRTQLSVIID